MKLAKLIALRFGLVFLALFALPFPLSVIPKAGSWIDEHVNDVWNWFDARVGDLFGLEVVRHPTGSGDTLADYLHLAILVALSLAAAAAWTLFDRNRRLDHPRLAKWSRVLLRYYLAATMLSYGFAKVFPGQFGTADDTNLYAQIGHKSPMGMLWTFMAVSRPYQIFGGLCECVGAALLLWRRTTLLGALLLLPTMTMVVVLNFCYDVPVKLFSSLLLVGVIVLLLPDARRLLAAVFARTDPPSSSRWPWAQRAGKALAIACFFGLTIYEQVTAGNGAALDTCFGVWDIDRVTRDGAEDTAPATRWKLIAIRSTAMLRTLDGEDHFHRVAKNDHEHLEFEDGGAFAVVLSGPRAVLTGTLEGHALVVEMHRSDPSQMPLLARGFHWIQEYPYNR